MNEQTTGFKIGDVVYDSYANPAVVIKVRRDPRTQLTTPDLIMQTIGSDAGNVTSGTNRTRRVTDEKRAESARVIAREEWRRRGYTRRQFGI